jgi:hypothetical protein
VIKIRILSNVLLEDVSILKEFIEKEKKNNDLKEYLHSDIAFILFDMYYSNIIDDSLYKDLLFGNYGIWNLVYENAIKETEILSPDECFYEWIYRFQDIGIDIYQQYWEDSKKCRDLNNINSGIIDCPSLYYSLGISRFWKVYNIDDLFCCKRVVGSVTEIMVIDTNYDISKIREVYVYNMDEGHVIMIGRTCNGFETFKGILTHTFSYLHDTSDEYMKTYLKVYLKSKIS